ncbi:MAG: ribonuclease III [Candidatus Moraniibacteriota bacterium]|nr:MAG: ribonuclease III [Candidatus Moranbacteria bacterium]
MTKKDILVYFESFGVEPNNIDLYQQAVTHRSYLNENRSYALDHNERLEFLGDAVLELVVTRYLYDTYPNPEGEMTSWRAALVCGEMLSSVANSLNIEPQLLMSRGEARDVGRARQYILANAVEAIIGAIYLDKGYEEAKKFVERFIISRLAEVLEKKLYLDSKSYFQEKAQEIVGITPTYKELSSNGPDHDRVFVVGAYLGNELIAEGAGPSKQEAQRNAARLALEKKSWL